MAVVKSFKIGNTTIELMTHISQKQKKKMTKYMRNLTK